VQVTFPGTGLVAVQDRVRPLVSERLDALRRGQPLAYPDALLAGGAIAVAVVAELGELDGVANPRRDFHQAEESAIGVVAFEASVSAVSFASWPMRVLADSTTELVDLEWISVGVGSSGESHEEAANDSSVLHLAFVGVLHAADPLAF
jgi:hypothetical protein